MHAPLQLTYATSHITWAYAYTDTYTYTCACIDIDMYMYMTTSGRPVILGNTRHPDVSSSRPYLITPSTRKDDCVSKEVDEVTTKNHDMETNDVDSETFTPVSKCVALKAEKVDIERKEVCKNVREHSSVSRVCIL